MMASARAEPIWGRASSCSLGAELMSIRPAWAGAVVVAAGLAGAGSPRRASARGPPGPPPRHAPKLRPIPHLLVQARAPAHPHLPSSDDPPPTSLDRMAHAPN